MGNSYKNLLAILVGVLKCWTQFWKRTTQELFQQSLVEIASVVSEKKEQNFYEIVIGWFSSKNVSGGSTLCSIFFFTCNFEVNLITHLGVLALFFCFVIN
jgi:hypothetical protein